MLLNKNYKEHLTFSLSWIKKKILIIKKTLNYILHNFMNFVMIEFWFYCNLRLIPIHRFFGHKSFFSRMKYFHQNILLPLIMSFGISINAKLMKMRRLPFQAPLPDTQMEFQIVGDSLCKESVKLLHLIEVNHWSNETLVLADHDSSKKRDSNIHHTVHFETLLEVSYIQKVPNYFLSICHQYC